MRASLLAIAVAATLRCDAAAEEPGRPALVIDYAAPSPCPGREHFEAEVTTRIEPGALSSDEATTVELWVTTREQEFVGDLLVRHRRAPIATRSLSGTSCDEVVDALALIGALAINASAEPHLEAPAATPVPVATPVPPLPKEPQRRWAYGVGVSAGLYQGLSPSVAGGGEIFFDVGYLRSWKPSLRLGAAVAYGGATDDLGRESSFLRSAGTIAICPARIALGKGFSIAPCARLEVGALQATGSTNGSTKTDSEWWIAPSLLGRLGWTVFRGLGVEAELGASFPLLRNRYYFPPSTTIYTTPVAAVVGRLGVTYSFRQ